MGAAAGETLDAGALAWEPVSGPGALDWAGVPAASQQQVGELTDPNGESSHPDMAQTGEAAKAGAQGAANRAIAPKRSASFRKTLVIVVKRYTPFESPSMIAFGVMSTRPPGSLLINVAAAALLAAALAASSACGPAGAHCDVCDRDECTALAFRVEYEDGGSQTTCCPKCASHAVKEAREKSGRQVARLRARDFASGGEIDAREAFYVEGSDVEHCMAPKEEPTTQSCCRLLTYDRCLPSLIAFGSREIAAAFVRDHGGELRSFDELGFGAR